MGIEEVPGFGPITKSNAKEIYKAYKKGEVDLNTSQKKYTESFLTSADFDEIEYDADVRAHSGENQIEDSKKADDHGGQGANAAATSVGGAVFAAGAAVLAKVSVKNSLMSGFAALGMGAATLACGIRSMLRVNAFDNGYKDRCECKDNASATNDTLDANAAAMEDTMDLMSEDYELYQQQSDVLTKNMNGQAASLAEAKQELADAQAAGDNARVQRAQAKIQKFEKAGFEDEEAEAEETKGRLEEYQAANVEAQGVSSAGANVADFLKEGQALGIVATVNAVLLTVAAVYTALSIGTSLISATKDSLSLNFAGAAAGIAGSVMFAVATALLGKNALTMSTKAKNEFECHSAGGDMESHVDSLNDMIEQQEAYSETTGENFDTVDEESGEARQKGQDNANKFSPPPPGGADDPGKKKKETAPSGNGQ